MVPGPGTICYSVGSNNVGNYTVKYLWNMFEEYQSSWASSTPWNGLWIWYSRWVRITYDDNTLISFDKEWVYVYEVTTTTTLLLYLYVYQYTVNICVWINYNYYRLTLLFTPDGQRSWYDICFKD